MAQTMYQKRAAQRRRTADITRLADEYQKNIQGITQSYEKSFGEYQTMVGEKQSAYEKSLAGYRSAYDVYQDQLSAYQSRMDDYEAALRAATKRETLPLEIRWDAKYNTFKYLGDTHTNMRLNPKGQAAADILKKYGLVDPGETFYKKQIQFTPSSEWDFEITRTTPGGQIAYVQFSRQASPTPKPFTEKAPTAPTAPKAPVIEDFDASQFEQQRTAAETTYKRELGERRSARKEAVSRTRARPLLQGA